MRQYCASAISSSARDRLTTRTHGTVSSAPEAERAMTPLSGGLCRSWVTIAAASNAAAERSTAPILCGSVTWPRTMIGRLLPAPPSSCRISPGQLLDTQCVGQEMGGADRWEHGGGVKLK